MMRRIGTFLMGLLRRLGIFLLLFVVVLAAVAPSAFRHQRFYGYFPWDTPPVVRLSVPEYDGEEVLDVVMPERNEFVDDPEVGDGLVLLDRAHDNNFTVREIGSLDRLLASRGFDFLSYEGGDLARQLRGVESFVVIAPLSNYSEKEITAVTDFVANGGRLLLMGDPARFTVGFIEDDFGYIVDFEIVTNELPLNDLANPFDISFEGDYLYNLTADGNESNFRNIVISR